MSENFDPGAGILAESRDTEFVQGCFNRGELIPPGVYHLRGTLTVPAAYPYGLIQPGVSLIGAGPKDVTTICFRGTADPG